MSVLPVSLPAEVRAGDAFSFTIQTQLTAGALVFYVLNGAAGNTPKRESSRQRRFSATVPSN